MLSYSRCCDFYKCPYLFQCHDEVEVTSNAIMVGQQIDTLLNCLLIKNIKDKTVREQAALRVGISGMLQKIIDNNDVCEFLKCPPMVKYWYVDFISSGLEVVDVQKYFELDDLEYRGYIDAVLTDGTTKYVVENKTTSRYYDRFFTSKKNSMQTVGYCIAENTDMVRYCFFNTKNMTEYTPISRRVTHEDIEEFKEWVNFVRDNQTCFVKNREYCSYHDCPKKEECYYG